MHETANAATKTFAYGSPLGDAGSISCMRSPLTVGVLPKSKSITVVHG